MRPAYEIREIQDGDLAEVTALLCEGFPRRSTEYWRAGLQRLSSRERPPDTEKYGYVLEADKALRGVVLTIPSVHDHGSHPKIIINISSWYVQPSLRGNPAKELYRQASRRPDVTYTNLSPARNTIGTITSNGFQEWTSGQMVAMGFRRSRSKKARILTWKEVVSDDPSSIEAKVLADHESFGCLTFYLNVKSSLLPFIFVRRYIKGWIPCAQLIYCGQLSDLVEYNQPISIWLATRGFPFMLIDASDPIKGLIGHHFDYKASKYYRGQRPVKAIDHTYSEIVILGF
jgi:hypothetical protein